VLWTHFKDEVRLLKRKIKIKIGTRLLCNMKEELGRKLRRSMFKKTEIYEEAKC
jgi:hypothetical protein